VRWIVYETRCLVSGKAYVGVHRQDEDGFDGYLGSGKAIRCAIKKHGVENFARRTLEEFSVEADAYAREAEIVTEEFCKRRDIYNQKPGGVRRAVRQPVCTRQQESARQGPLARSPREDARQDGLARNLREDTGVASRQEAHARGLREHAQGATPSVGQSPQQRRIVVIRGGDPARDRQVRDLSQLILPGYRGLFEAESPRLCRKCGLYPPTSAFYENKRAEGMFVYHVCKRCHKQRVAETRAEQVGTPNYIASRMYDATKRRAAERCVSCTVTRDWFREKIEAGQCELTKLPFHIGTEQRHLFQPSPDRIDSSRGYEPDNTRLILWMLNAAKGDSDETMFIQCLKKVAEAMLHAA